MNATHSRMTRLKRNHDKERNRLLRKCINSVECFTYHEGELVGVVESVREMVARAILRLAHIVPEITAKKGGDDNLDITLTTRLCVDRAMLYSDQTILKYLSEALVETIRIKIADAMRNQWGGHTL